MNASVSGDGPDGAKLSNAAGLGLNVAIIRIIAQRAILFKFAPPSGASAFAISAE